MISSSIVFTDKESEFSQKTDYKPNERINPFDKNNPVSSSSSNATTITGTSSYDPRNYTSSLYKPSTTTTSTDVPATEIFKPTADLNRKQPEIEKKSVVKQSLSKHPEYRRDIRSNSITTNTEYSATKYSSKNVSSASLSSQDDPANISRYSIDSGAGSDYKSKFTRSSGSLSDAELIFGDIPKPKKTDSYSFGSSTESDSIFASGSAAGKQNFAKSISVTSEKDGDFSHDPRVASYKIYDGIQNHAFQDYESPVKNNSQAKDDDYDLK